MPPAPRTYYVITTRGDVGPYTRAELREQLQSGAVRSGDQVRNAFGRPLGTVAEAMSDASSSRTPAHAGPPIADPPAPPTPRRSPAPLIIGVAAAVLIAAIVLVSILSRPTAPVAPPAPPPAVETPAPAAPIPSPQADAPAPVAPASLPADAAPPRAAAPPQDGALPDGWSFLDLGNARPKGKATFADGLWTVEGGGADVWFKRDECGFVHREADGDFSAIVRVLSLQDTDAWDKAGIMVRSSVDESAPMVYLLVTHGGTLRFTLRKKPKVDAETVGAGTASLPVWLQLTRRGKTFGGYWSSDGKTWTGVGNKIDLANVAVTARLGLAVCSHNRSVANRAVFSDVSVTTPR